MGFANFANMRAGEVRGSHVLLRLFSDVRGTDGRRQLPAWPPVCSLLPKDVLLPKKPWLGAVTALSGIKAGCTCTCAYRGWHRNACREQVVPYPKEDPKNIEEAERHRPEL